MTKSFENSDVIWLDCVDSTNEEIKRRFQELFKPTWIIAKEQTNGKGRNGNIWFSSSGNFSGSVMFFPTIERSYFHLYGFLFGVALHNTVKKITRYGVDIRLKWPNDLMIENGKVAGILLESIQSPQSNQVAVIVGVGVNLNSHPNLNLNVRKRYNSQCVSNFSNHEICRESFFNKFSDELKELGLYVEENGLASILKLWRHRSYDKGTQIQVSDNKGGVNSGKFLGLDELGGLIMSDNSGTKKIYSGDVYFGS